MAFDLLIINGTAKLHQILLNSPPVNVAGRLIKIRRDRVSKLGDVRRLQLSAHTTMFELIKLPITSRNASTSRGVVSTERLTRMQQSA